MKSSPSLLACLWRYPWVARGAHGVNLALAMLAAAGVFILALVEADFFYALVFGQAAPTLGSALGLALFWASLGLALTPGARRLADDALEPGFAHPVEAVFFWLFLPAFLSISQHAQRLADGWGRPAKAPSPGAALPTQLRASAGAFLANFLRAFALGGCAMSLIGWCFFIVGRAADLSGMRHGRDDLIHVGAGWLALDFALWGAIIAFHWRSSPHAPPFLPTLVLSAKLLGRALLWPWRGALGLVRGLRRSAQRAREHVVSEALSSGAFAQAERRAIEQASADPAQSSPPPRL